MARNLHEAAALKRKELDESPVFKAAQIARRDAEERERRRWQEAETKVKEERRRNKPRKSFVVDQEVEMKAVNDQKRPERVMAIGALGRRDGIPLNRIPAGTGAVSHAYRRQIDSGPTTTDLANDIAAKREARRRRNNIVLTPQERRKEADRIRRMEKSWLQAIGLGLGILGRASKYRSEGQERKLRKFSFRTALLALLTPLSAHGANEGYHWYNETERKEAEAAARAQAFREYVEGERLHPGEQAVNVFELSPLMREALERRESGSISVNSLMSRWLGQGGRPLKLSLDRDNGESVLHIDLGETLQELWEYKNSRRISRGEAAREGLREVVPDFQARLVRGELYRSSLSGQLADAYHPGNGDESITRIVARNLDWQGYAEREGISEHRELLEAAASQLDPMMLYAIYIAEVIPGEGFDGVAQLDLVLRMGGQAYALNLPSLADSHIRSKGLSQTTDHLFSRYGAVPSVSPYLPEEAYRALQIPEGDAINLRPNSGTVLADEHTLITSGDEFPENAFEIDSMRAEEVITIFNAIKSLSTAIRDERAREGLRFIVANRQREHLLEFVDMAHNNPSEATEALGRWARHRDLNRPVYLDMGQRTRPEQIARAHGMRGSAAYRALIEYFDREEIQEAVAQGRGIRLRG